MSLITTGNSSVRRWKLIKEALNVFTDHPLLGIGLNNFRYFTSESTYSHCFYSEILACSGIVGTVMVLSPMILLFANLVSRIENVPDGSERKRSLYILFLYCIFLLMISAQIYIYAYHLMFALAIINSMFYIDIVPE